MIIKFSRVADRDLDAIRSFIAEDNPDAAERSIVRILQSIRHLAGFPLLGRLGLVSGTGELTVAGLPYRVVYRITGDVVEVLAVIHARRQWP